MGGPGRRPAVSRNRAHTRRAGRCALAILLTAATVGWIGEGSSSAAGPAELISVNPDGGGPLSTQDNAASVSGDGNVVAFTANPPAGSEFASDWVYVRDRVAGVTTAVPSPAFPVTAMNNAVVSRDGCHVAFWGFAPTPQIIILFIPAQWDIYSWNRCVPNSLPVVISRGSTGDPFPLFTGTGDTRGTLAISADGRYVAYYAFTSAAGQRLGRIDTSGVITEAKLFNGVSNSNSIDISDDGAYVAIGGQRPIGSVIRNVVVGWVPPCITGAAVFCNTEVISAGNNGQPLSGASANPSLSADGRYVAFTSNSPDVIGAAAVTAPQVYVRDRTTGVTRLVTTSPGQVMGGTVDEAEISPDGTQIALMFSANPPPGGKPVKEVFVARSSSGFFDSSVFDLVSYGVSDAPTTTDSFAPSMSSNGRYVAFTSAANIELSGVPPPNGLNIWMRERPIALDITPTLDFGTIPLGGQSAPQDAVVTNTSGVDINIGAVTPPAAPFSIIANGCGGVLAPGATCAVTIVFSPTAPGGASSSVSVSGDGLSVSTSLVGVGQSPNVPTPGSLTIAPGSANYGSGAVGSSFPAKTFTVTNPGGTAVTIAGTGLSGSGADQFAIGPNTCTGSLGPGASCTVAVAATLTREGALSATLGILGTAGEAAGATLRVSGTVQLFTPELLMNPGVVSAGEITVAVGSGFPPNIDVELAFRDEAPFATVHTDAAGAFRFNFLVLRNGTRIGGREVVAIDQPQFTGVFAPLLIDLATFRPAGFSSPAFTSGVRSMVSRAG
jgi:WD40-like Beta Propeller Repeat